ncbi:MAG: [ribosomal protein S5]-alanine N-acetyltransferase [Alphaproteobacteria bacterium]|jgi:ribosomal-protein-alanine N-acetyltransferase|nr:[ribosomal protein S5]-alanine N-acetyltransferase [Alphaproteobacteria bacterium]
MFTRGMIFPGGRAPILQGDGVLLRYPQMSDYAQWSKLRDESREFLAPWEPTWALDELSREAFRRRLRRYQREIRDDVAYPFLLFRRPGDFLMGGCTLSNVRRGVTQSAAVGYWVGSRYARHGHMFAALNAMLPFVFGVLGLHRLEAACIPENEASRSLLLKIGFREEGKARRYLQINGEWRDHILFALLEDDAPVG